MFSFYIFVNFAPLNTNRFQNHPLKHKMQYLFSIIVPLSIAILIHEAGHFCVAKWYKVGITRVSLFLNIGFTFLKYDPISGRLSIISRKVPLELVSSSGESRMVEGEWVLLSIPITRAIAGASWFDTETDSFYEYKGILYNTNLIRMSSPHPVSKWRMTQYCIGWLPFGGYVSLKTGRGKDSITNLAPMKQLAVNIAGVVCNFFTIIIALLLLRMCFNPLHFPFTGGADLLFEIAYLSFALLWLNILPLPGLDGGNIILNIISIFWPQSDKNKAMRSVYNFFSILIFVFIISSWFRTSSSIETQIFKFFDSIFGEIMKIFLPNTIV